MLEINKGKQTTLFSPASIFCISRVNRSGSLSSRGRKQFLLLVTRNLGKSKCLAQGLGWGQMVGGTSARLGRWSTWKRAVLWSDSSTISLLLLDCTCFLHPGDNFFFLSRNVLLNSWINWKCSHLSLFRTGLNTHSSALNSSPTSLPWSTLSKATHFL